MMKSVLKVAASCLMVSGVLAAAPPACVTGTLASYIALGAEGCAFDGNVFANFAYSAKASGGAATIRADQIQVAPTFIAPEASRFSFSAPWSARQSQSQDSVISYTTVLPCGDTTAAQLVLTLGSAQVGGTTGDVTVEESTNLGQLRVFDRCVEVCQAKSIASLNFNPVIVLLISDRVHLSGGTNGASTSGFAGLLNRCYPCAAQ